MVLTDYIKEDHIILDFKAQSKKEALEALCYRAAQLHDLPPENLLKVVLARETMGSTGLGGAVALPHGKSPEALEPILILALSPAGIDFDSLDGEPVKIFILIITPQVSDGRIHLQLLSRLGGLFKSLAAVEELLKASTAAEVYNFLAKRDL